jgi:hypothetical protein
VRPISGVPLGTLVGHLEQHLVRSSKEPPTVYGIRVRPWATLGLWASIAVGVPLAVLILGASLVWAFSGFAATRSGE